MIRERTYDQGWYCTICRTTYAHYTNIPLKCLNGQCKRGNKNGT